MTAPGSQPAPVGPDLECTVCQHVSSPHGVPVSAATPGQAAYEGYASDSGSWPIWESMEAWQHRKWERAAQRGHAVIAAQDARPAPGPDADTATAVYLEAISILSAGLRDIRDASPDAPAGGYARGRAVLALNLADRVQPPAQPAPELAAAAMREAASRELAASMAESRGYREALQQVAKHHDDAIAQVRIVAKIAKRALEGK